LDFYIAIRMLTLIIGIGFLIWWYIVLSPEERERKRMAQREPIRHCFHYRIYTWAYAVMVFFTIGLLVWVVINSYLSAREKIQKIQQGNIKEEAVLEEVIKDETADWQTYRNEEYGFEMKYPKDWEECEPLEDYPNYLLRIIPPISTSNIPKGMDTETFKGYSCIYGGLRFGIIKEKYATLGDLKNYYWNLYQNTEGIVCNPELMIKEITFNGQPALQREVCDVSGMSGGSIISFIHNQEVFDILISEDANRTGEELINKIFSTFRFIAPQVEIISPNGGEKWTIGNTYDILWKSEGFKDIDIGIVGGHMAPPYWEGPYIATSVDTTSGKYSWTIPEGYQGDYWRIFIGNLPPDPEKSGWFMVGLTGTKYIFSRSAGYFQIVEE